MAIASGLLVQLGFIEGTVLAFRELIWKFSLPVFIGDTIRDQATITDLKAVKRLGGGVGQPHLNFDNLDMDAITIFVFRSPNMDFHIWVK